MFVKALLSRDAKRRASLWTDDGTVVPTAGGFFRGPAVIESHFVTGGPSITPDLAFVDTCLTLNHVLLGPDGQVHAAVPIVIVFAATRQGGRWSIQDERAHFAGQAGS